MNAKNMLKNKEKLIFLLNSFDELYLTDKTVKQGD